MDRPVAGAGYAHLRDLAADDLRIGRLLEQAEAELRIHAADRVPETENVFDHAGGRVDQLAVLPVPVSKPFGDGLRPVVLTQTRRHDGAQLRVGGEAGSDGLVVSPAECLQEPLADPRGGFLINCHPTHDTGITRPLTQPG